VKRILVALDGSPRAAQVLAAAVRLAELTAAQLILYRAISVAPDLPRSALAPFLATDARLEDVLVHNARTELGRLAETVPAGQIEQIVVGFATAWDGICREARERDVDLIAIGSHGYGGLDRVVGTVAAKVVNHADRNVLVVRTAL
jgi:nucleotide-binding universal stress UspA family protein